MKVPSQGALVDHLVVPYTLDTNDMRFSSPGGFPSGEQFFAHLRDAFDVLYRRARRVRRRCCRWACTAGWSVARRGWRVWNGSSITQSHDDVWITRRIDIADHWRSVHPAGSAVGQFASRWFTMVR